MILAWTGEVRNLSGNAVVIVNSCGNVIRSYKCDGTATAHYCESYFGMLNGDAPMGYFETVDISGLPEAKLRVYYIVNWTIAFAAQQMGRSVDDLLVPVKPFYRDSPLENSSPKKGKRSSIKPKKELAGYQALMPAMFFFDPGTARRRYETPQKYNAQLG